ncbi:hypothetical protein [Rhizobium leguminosarum]|uniref:hypothetical protein n=1 Tax=Rhizobium leguminosarum TaxID=384 RepID=UPI001C968405|nr:hypothetical protein [Rhizobium leguminosarum]MBY5581392.1 hypothetical protein [Rhizobium leguminosarum]MBY5607093.1 hypothetical protein [Rhizobium leguminosarum]
MAELIEQRPGLSRYISGDVMPRSPPWASLQTEAIVTTFDLTAAMSRALLFEGNLP